MYTTSYLIPVMSGLFDYAMQEASAEDFQFFAEFLVNKDLTQYSAILTTSDHKHFQLSEVGKNADVLSDLAIEVATHAVSEYWVNCTGKEARWLQQNICKERQYNNAIHGMGRICDLVTKASPSDNLTCVEYEST